ncbi:hypothetical protein GCM10010253_58520 [Streptomyces badius]|uniref:Uncharacterized protein n=1 Tax=Streptomyces badius TaxID=1941 RepID=A0ABQ2TLW9_STRBA|nr:hypothetical protein GCM10010253_58520 [Streptomyces badius]
MGEGRPVPEEWRTWLEAFAATAPASVTRCRRGHSQKKTLAGSATTASVTAAASAAAEPSSA